MGGLTAAVLLIPTSMGLGILVVQPLGDRYVPHGALAGLYSAIIVCSVALLLGSRSTIIYAPRSLQASLMGSIVLQTFAESPAVPVDLADVRGTLTLLFFIVLVAGLAQALFGALRLGGLVRYIPSPVIAGFQNAAAVLIIASQLHLLLGLARPVPLSALPGHLPSLQPLTLAVGLATILTIWQAPRVVRGVSPTILGLIAGTLAYYLIASVGRGSGLGPTIGAMPMGMPVPGYVRDLAGLPGALGPSTLVPLAAAALSLAVVASLDGLLCAKVVEAATGTRTRGDAELLRIGVGSAAAAAFGGILASVHLGSSIGSHRAGAETRASVGIAIVTTLLVVAVLAPLLARVPRVVIAGMLVMVGVQLFDRWTFQMLRRLLAREFLLWRRMALDLGVIVLVAGVAIAVDLVTAVAVGVGVAVLFFLSRMSKSVVRRAYHGDAVHSRRTRDPRLMQILHAHGKEILVLELEGPIFFGTAEALAARVEAAQRGNAACVIFDLKRVNEIDTTGARILLQIQRALAMGGRHLLLSHLTPDGALARFLEDMEVTRAVTPARIFLDTDRALEWAEDRLIARELGAERLEDEFSVDHLDVLAGLSAGERDILRRVLVRRGYRRGEVVFREGDAGRELFIIARGSASVKLRLAGQERERRLATFSAGTVFGELALLDGGPRSASVEADEDLVCYVLSEAAFAALGREHPGIALALLTNLGRELSQRLRRANQTIFQLES